MRLARFVTTDEPRFGVVAGDPGEEQIAVVDGDPLYRKLTPTSEILSLADVRLLAPVIPRSKVIGIGRNYADHAAELGNAVPAEPLMFLKPNTSVIGPGDPIVLPPQSSEVHFEAELAVVIGRLCKDVPLNRVPEVIFGYTCANDVTARDLQRSDDQWTRAKGFDTFCPVGPWIETDLDVSSLDLTCTVSGQLKQSGNTSDLIFDIATLVSYVSSVFTLLPGDLILTGTPAGVGPLVAGDVVDVTIESLGTLSNPVVTRNESSL